MLVLSAQASRADVRFLPHPSYFNESSLDVCMPTRPSTPFGMAYIVSGDTCFITNLTACHISISNGFNVS